MKNSQGRKDRQHAVIVREILDWRASCYESQQAVSWLFQHIRIISYDEHPATTTRERRGIRIKSLVGIGESAHCRVRKPCNEFVDPSNL